VTGLTTPLEGSKKVKFGASVFALDFTKIVRISWQKVLLFTEAVKPLLPPSVLKNADVASGLFIGYFYRGFIQSQKVHRVALRGVLRS